MEQLQVMANTLKKNINLIFLGKLLLRLQNGEDLGPILETASAIDLQKIRNFLEGEIQYFSAQRDSKTQSLSEIKSNYEPPQNYYYKQECREPLEACLNETCLNANPKCFSRKMKANLKVLVKLVTPYLEKQ